MDKDSKAKAIIVITAITLTALTSIVFCIKHAKDVRAQEALAAKTAIPQSQVADTVAMLEGLEVPNYYPINAKIALESSGKSSEQTIEVRDNLNYKIATLAISDGTNTKTNITGIEVQWYFGLTTITLTGDLDGWETIRWESKNYDLKNTLYDRPKTFTIEDAENYKFKVLDEQVAVTITSEVAEKSKVFSVLYPEYAK